MQQSLFISHLQSDPAFFFAVIITVVVSITLHELAHGYAAIRLGDDTPIHTGHMTLNPLVHMGGFSLILLAIAGIAYGAMPVDRTRLRGKYGEALMAAAGPATNLLLAIISLSALGLWERFDHTPYSAWSPQVANAKYLLFIFGNTNLILTMFNLLPVPPLDGSWIAANVFPAYRRLLSHDTARGLMSALFIAVFLGAGVYLQRAAIRTTLRYETAISGRPMFHFGVIHDRVTILDPEEAKQYDLLISVSERLKHDAAAR